MQKKISCQTLNIGKYASNYIVFGLGLIGKAFMLVKA